MTTSKIAYESALPELLMKLLGTKEVKNIGGTSSNIAEGKTTSTGGTSTTVGTANTDPLMQIFGEQMRSSTPDGMQALLTELFTKGAEAVPVLTDAMANAVGTRSTKNSGLALALAELNKSLAGKAATMATAQQAQASTTAANIAQTTRGQTITDNKVATENRTEQRTAAPSTVTTKTGDSKAAVGTGLAGLLLNAADKAGLLDSIKDRFKLGTAKSTKAGGTSLPSSPLNYGVTDTAAQGLTYDAHDLQNVPSSPSSPLDYGVTDNAAQGLIYDAYDLQNVPSLSMPNAAPASGNFGGGWNPDGIDFSNLDFGFNDVANFGGDLANGAMLDEAATGWGYDAYDFQDVASNAGGFFSGMGDSISNFFSSFFADGGLVDSKKLRSMESKASGYADGGQVTRNRNNMGGPVNRGTRTNALNYTQSADRPQATELQRNLPSISNMSTSLQGGNSLSSAQFQQSPSLRDQYIAMSQRRAEQAEKDLKAWEDLSSSGPGTPGTGVVGTPAQNDAALASLGISALAAISPALGLATSVTTGVPGMISQAVTGLISAISQALGFGSPAAAVGTGDNDAANAAAAATSPTSSPAAMGMDAQAAENETANAAANAAPGDAPGEGGGVGGAGASAGDASVGNVAADGGKINGKGTGISDRIGILVSDGEFVISKDVVDTIGADFFQTLQDQFHTPAAIQRMQGGR